MSSQSIFSAILALLLVHALISTVTGTPITASAVADTFSDPTRNTSLAWPTYLPGWGTITVSRDKLADEYRVDILEQSGAWDAMPPIYNIHRPGPGVCRNPYSFPDTNAVSGRICLPDGEDYNSMAKDVMTNHSGTMGCSGAWGCFCDCIVTCAVLYPFCALGCYACPDAGVFGTELLTRASGYAVEFVMWRQSSNDSFDEMMNPSGIFSG